MAKPQQNFEINVKTEPREVPNIQCAVLTRVAGTRQEISGGEAEP